MDTRSPQPLTVQGHIGYIPILFLIDTGSSLTLINYRLFNQLDNYFTYFRRRPSSSLYVRLANKSPLAVQWILDLPITLNHVTRWHTVYVIRELWRQCIIGNDFIRRHNLQINGANQTVYFRKFSYKHNVNFHVQKHPTRRLHSINTLDHRYQSPVESTSIFHRRTPHPSNLNRYKPCLRPKPNINQNMTSSTHRTQPKPSPPIDTTPITMFSDDHNIQETTDLSESILSLEEKLRLSSLLESFPQVFSNVPGRTDKLQHHINLIEGTKPRNSPPYRYAPARRKLLEDQLTEMLQNGVITPSKSPWASPVVLIPKKDGSIRFCIDFRKLNEVTVRDAYPLPRIDDTLDELQNAKFVSTLDLRSGYWQVEMDAASRPITAFVTHKGLFECVVMPFGLTNAPATFQRLMDIVLAGLKWRCCLVYLDDIIVYSPTFDQHLSDLQNVLQALAAAHLTLKASKCYFCRREMKFLGHVITSNGIKPDPGLTSTITQFPQPAKIKDVQAFLGLTGYYRRFIQNYAKIAEPLLKLLRSRDMSSHNTNIQWNDDCTSAFLTLKQRLVSAPIMQPPDFNYSFILELDACEYGIGCVLTQEYHNHKYVIAYASRTLSTAERNYSSVEREALAIVWATKHFRQYLEGGPVIIRSDCKALQWLKSARDPTGRLARWAMKLSPYNIIIQHRPGVSNPNGDFVSRYPLSDVDSNDFEVCAIESGLNIWEGTNILHDIQCQQLQDPRLQRIIQHIKDNPSKPFGDKHAPYLLMNNLLYKVRHLNSYTGQRVFGQKYLLVIPQPIQSKILQWAHDHPTAGHAGRTKTFFRLSSRVYWPSMRKDVFKYIQSCKSCQQFKYNNAPTAAPMQLHMVTQPWHTIGIDIMGPFPPTFRQKRYLLVIVDYFTRWVELFALRRTTATDIVNILINEVICRYGIPSYILSDNGPQFIADLFSEMCRLLGIGHKLTANYHPQTNMSERVNRNLKAQIAIYAQSHPGFGAKSCKNSPLLFELPLMKQPAIHLHI
jgi:RNase H-like domain found in reverse transcriptase/Reverse transcriptase (RNA-dependent DNA polymerase)/Integrase zinc binding domain/Integrase core domain